MSMTFLWQLNKAQIDTYFMQIPENGYVDLSININSKLGLMWFQVNQSH